MSASIRDPQKQYSASAVARYILNQARSKPIPHMGIAKLIRLVYVAQGYSLAKLGKPLFEEDVEAWRYGPVIKSVYENAELRPPDEEKGILGDFDEEAQEIAKNPEVVEILDEVINKYRNYTAEQLTYATHKEGSPWEWAASIAARIIPTNIIASYYDKELSKT